MTWLLALLGAVTAGTCYATPIRSHPVATVCTDAIRGDVDGDGKADEVAIASDVDGATLWLCTARGERLSIDDVANHNLLLLDVDGDGAEEMLPGGTTVSSAGYEVVKYVDGRLVRLALTLNQGVVGQDKTAAWGCDARHHVVQATVDWPKRLARIETIVVTGTRVSRTATTRRVPSGADRYTYADTLVTACPGVVTR